MADAARSRVLSGLIGSGERYLSLPAPSAVR